LRYLEWAQSQGVAQVCFKELYVSTRLESRYVDTSANRYSERNQVPLSVVLEAMDKAGFAVEHTLAWGAPVFRGELNGKPMQVAAYPEPSLYWERSHGLARRWN